MDIQKRQKLKNLLNHWPDGVITTSVWLRQLGISRQLVQSYVQKGWIKSLGSGAYQRITDTVKWYGALSGLQQKNKLLIHVGGPTSIAVHQASHYLRLSNKEKIFLFSQPRIKLPKWFCRNIQQPVQHIRTSCFKSNFSTHVYTYKNIKIRCSSLERAIMECLYISPKYFDLLECYQVLEGLRTLRPYIVQKMLMICSSIKIKRLFLYMAEKANLPVFKKLQLGAVDLGRGDRSIVKNGVYNSKYKISIPKEFAKYK